MLKKKRINLSIVDISNKVEQLSNNSKLINICEKFLDETSVLNFNFEILAIPFVQKDNEYKPTYNIENIDKLSTIKNIDNIKDVLIAVLSSNSKYVTNTWFKKGLSNKEINYFIESVIKNKILDGYNFDYSSILMLLCLLDRKKHINYYKNKCEEFNINDNDTENKIVEILYKNDFERKQITYMLACKELISNYKDTFCVINWVKENFVENYIDNIDSAHYIQRLENPNRVIKYTMCDIDLMTGYEFEAFITNLFNSMGYKAEKTKLSGDQGIDVIAKKGKEIIAIQTKCYSKPVGNGAIQEVVAGKSLYGATKLMVITNSHFTKSAKELAKANNVILWDRQLLEEKIEQVF